MKKRTGKKSNLFCFNTAEDDELSNADQLEEVQADAQEAVQMGEDEDNYAIVYELVPRFKIRSPKVVTERL